MNNVEMEHLKRITDLCVDRREIIEQQSARIAELERENKWRKRDTEHLLELGEKYKELESTIADLTAANENTNNLLDEQGTHINEQALKIKQLTAHNESMQADAVNNTATIKMLMAQLAEQVEENRGMRKLLRWEPK